MIESVNRLLYVLTRWVAWVGMAFLLGAMMVTATDIVLRKATNSGIFGAVDIVQLMIMGAAFLSIPYGFMTRGHVAVTLVVDRFNRRFTALAAALAAVLAFGLMSGVAWFGFEQAMQQVEYGDISLTLGVPKIYYWLPLLAGSALSALVCVHLAVESLHMAVTGRGGATPETGAER